MTHFVRTGEHSRMVKISVSFATRSSDRVRSMRHDVDVRHPRCCRKHVTGTTFVLNMRMVRHCGACVHGVTRAMRWGKVRQRGIRMRTHEHRI